MKNVKMAELHVESIAWRAIEIGEVKHLEIPTSPSAFADNPRVCGQGLEEICLASTVVASG